MRRRKTLVKPPLRTVCLKNSVHEKISFLEIPSDPESYSLAEDVRQGAAQFRSLKELAESGAGLRSRILAITARDREMGLMAVTYLAMEVQKRKAREGDLPFDTEFDEAACSWYESVNRIPVLSASEIQSGSSPQEIPFESGGYLYGTVRIRDSHEPFWRSCHQESLVILVNREQWFGEEMDFPEVLSRDLRLYVVFLDGDPAAGGGELSDLPFGVPDRERFRALRNSFILTYAAQELEVSFEETDPEAYYRHVLLENIRQRGIRLKRGVSPQRILHLASSVSTCHLCTTIDRIVAYAVKDREGEEICLGNRDFDFVDRFLREPVSGGKGKTKSARALLEEQLVGLPEIKQQVLDIVGVMKYQKARRERRIGSSGYHNVHLMLGAPGTAKTTVAGLMGRILFEEKLLPDSRMVCVSGAELKGMYVGHSAPKTRALLEKYDVIIIDEAYSIAESGGETDSYGNEAIAQLILELERHGEDKLVIFAGYGGEDVCDRDNRMKDFLDANPGIRSRISSTFFFRSYTPGEMREIFLRLAGLGQYRPESGCGELVERYFEKRTSDPSFGNGREARALLEMATVFAARRLEQKKHLTDRDLRTLLAEDVQNAIRRTEEQLRTREAQMARIGF
ncbi:MAG: AAA family ATPase [Lachnospiraceae bacterium]|nr:AAA family ATPase [Lachnospiraceae bacterium]